MSNDLEPKGQADCEKPQDMKATRQYAHSGKQQYVQEWAYDLYQ